MHLPSYSIGSKVYDKIPEICEPYGTKVIAIGGHKAINAAKDKIIKACEKSNLEILDFIWYGGEATYENVEELNHYTQMGVTASKMCYEPIMRYGKEAMESNNEGKVSYAYEQVVLAIIVSTGIASIFLTAEHIIDYNTGLAHAIFYSLTSYPHIEKNHLHGEVVSYGVLNLLLVDGNEEDFEKVYEFSKSVGLPTKLKDLEFDSSQLEEIAKIAVEMKDIDHNPYKITKEMVEESIRKLEAM